MLFWMCPAWRVPHMQNGKRAYWTRFRGWQGYGAHEAGVGDGHDETKEALSPHLPGGSPSAEQQQTIMYGEQASVTQEMLQQPGNGMHYVTAAPDQG